MAVDRSKIEAAHAAFRRIADSGDWSGFADLFAETGTFVNSMLPEPLRGRDAIRSFSMQWPVVVNVTEWLVIEGNRLAVGWNERQRGMREDAAPYRGISTFAFDDDGLVSAYEGMFDPAKILAALEK